MSVSERGNKIKAASEIVGRFNNFDKYTTFQSKFSEVNETF